ncbi:MAG: thermonuclease family protein [Akkermansiaceae bacterium]
MPKKRSKSSSFLLIIILVVAGAFWIFENYKSFAPDNKTNEGKTSSQSEITKTGVYETFQNCSLVSDRGNDGDSFKVKLPDGRIEIIRLYFVDSPESAFKSYRNGETNHARIGHQARAFNITPEQAVEIGKKAKNYTLSLLSKSPFTIHTEWDSPFNDQRYHAFIEFDARYKPRFLHERLVKEGLARIYTKGAEMPDGTSEKEQESQLRKIEKTAKTTRAGGWSF